MPPLLVLFLSLLLTLCLLVYDSRNTVPVSKAIWIPTIWMTIAGSRLLSQWLGWNATRFSIDVLQEGNIIDRSLFTGLIVLGGIVLLRRKVDLAAIFRRNPWILAFILYCGLSVFWSEYPYVAFKRWVKEIGNFVMVMVILTEDEPIEAIKKLIRRFAYFAIPLSIVLIKYFPHLSRRFNEWTGEGTFMGVTTSKNMLGNLCMICGLFLFWDLLMIRKEWTKGYRRMQGAINICLLIMTGWLLLKADSATSILTLIFGSFLMLALDSRFAKRHIEHAGFLLFLGFCFGAILIASTDIVEAVVAKVGRDMTFTTRTYMWKELLSLNTDPIFGVGYESFWLGERLQSLWNMKYLRWVTQAHNGYLEIYLNLGYVGLALLTGAILTSFRKICHTLSYHIDFGRYRLSLFTIVLIYNFSEAAFKGIHLVWFVFLLVMLDVAEFKPKTSEQYEPDDRVPIRFGRYRFSENK